MDYNNFLNIRKNIIEKEFSRMNDMQKKAVFRIKGPLLILAGAGSGKTTVLVNRISNLLKYGDAYNSEKSSRTPDEYDVELMQRYLAGDSSVYHEIRDVLSYDAPMPWQILAITFTNKAANELKERLVKMLGDNAADIWACTFHSACLRILRRNGDKLGFSSHFTIYDTDDSKRVMKECQKLLGVDDKFLSHKTILNEISKAKDGKLSGEVVFKLYDTYGFPFELTQEIAEESGITVSHDEFDAEMNKQKERARNARNVKDSFASQNE